MKEINDMIDIPINSKSFKIGIYWDQVFHKFLRKKTASVEQERKILGLAGWA